VQQGECATSESYNSREAALDGIESVKKNAPGATTEDETKG
jgi:uncharacterized protein